MSNIQDAFKYGDVANAFLILFFNAQEENYLI
jgi:hypothetical protein